MITPVRVNPVVAHPAERRSVLGSGWRFRLDPDDRGLAEGWRLQPETISEPVAADQWRHGRAVQPGL